MQYSYIYYLSILLGEHYEKQGNHSALTIYNLAEQSVKINEKFPTEDALPIFEGLVRKFMEYDLLIIALDYINNLMEIV